MKLEELEKISKIAEELYMIYNTLSQKQLSKNKDKEASIKTIILMALREGMKIK